MRVWSGLLVVVVCAAIAAPVGAARGPEVIEVDAAIEVGDLADLALNDEVVAMATVDRGYWFAAADGGVFAFGDAGFHGSMGGVALNAPIVGMASTGSGAGYWLVAADGGVFAFGDAGFVGSIGDVGSASPVVGVAPAPAGDGYALLDRNGTIWRFPDRSASAEADEVAPAVAVIWTDDALDVVHADGTIVRREGSGEAPVTAPVDGRVVTAAATPAGGVRLAVVPGRITIAAGGDVHGESRVARVLASGRNPLEPVAVAMSAADIGIVNLETAVGTSGRAAAKRFTFRSAPELVHRLAEAGVDVVSLANNHALDYGTTALFETIDHARAAGLAVVGAGRDAFEAYAPALVETDGGTVAVIGLSQVLSRGWAATADRPGLASGHDRAASIAAVVRAAELADTVVVAVHWGRELDRCASAGQRDLARALVAAGADVILGHHPHVLQGIDRVGDAVVAYSLGNFVWYHSRLPSAETALLEVDVEAGRAVAHRVRPAVIDTEGRPVPVDGARAARIVGATEAYRPGAGVCPA